MQTYCFIGSDKNGGKTTAFNYVYDRMHRGGQEPRVCVTGIGINGETSDSYDGSSKPTIRLRPGSYFLTHARHLSEFTGKYWTHAVLGRPHFHEQYVLGRCTAGFNIILEGPNSGHELLAAKEIATGLLAQGDLLIDGSLDRQFLADPAISDMFYFSILFSRRDQQRQRAELLLRALQLPPGPAEAGAVVGRLKTAATRSLLFAPDGEIFYHGEEMPFADSGLLRACESLGTASAWLYLDGALTRSLADFLAPLAGIALLLDNFTLYQAGLSQSMRPGTSRALPVVTVLNPVRLKAIFVKEEAGFDRGLLPVDVPVINLFRQGADHAS